MLMNDAPEPPASGPGRRRLFAMANRSLRGGLLPLLIMIAVVSTGCGSSTTVTGQADRSQTIAALPAEIPETLRPTPSAPTATRTADAAEPTPTPHPITEVDTSLPRAPVGFDELFVDAVPGPRPVSIVIADVDVSGAVVIPVGVNDDLSFEVPPADQVGWYEYGAAPGEPGSTVLAAHIAYNGVDGVFRYLEDVEVGAEVTVTMDDGSVLQYRIEEVVEYVKEDLPESLFARDGKEQLALITCGGNFNYQLDSYESNTVAIAVPI